MQRAALTKQLYGAPTQFAAANKKFAVGKNPLELESELDVIQPQNAQQQKRMVEVMEALYKDAKNDPAKRVALEMWRMQLQSADAESLVKTDFQKRFYFWLLGRGTKEDTDKTFWGRGNMAAHNPEVAAYIDQFLESRANYAMQLALLANRAPTSLLGAYLYFKYIVNGNLKQTTKGDKTWWHLDQSDYLEDFDLFRKYFDKVPDGNGGERAATRDDQYSKLVQPQQFRTEVDPNAPANAGQEPYPITSEQKETWALKDDAGIKESIGMVEAETEDPLWNSQWGINPDKPPKKPKPGRPLPGGASEDPVPSAGAANLPANVATVDSAAIAAQVTASLAEERRTQERERATRKQQKAERKARKAEEEKAYKEKVLQGFAELKDKPAAVSTPALDLEKLRADLEQFHAKGFKAMGKAVGKAMAADREKLTVLQAKLSTQLEEFGTTGKAHSATLKDLNEKHTETLDAVRDASGKFDATRTEYERLANLKAEEAAHRASMAELRTAEGDAVSALQQKLLHSDQLRLQAEQRAAAHQKQAEHQATIAEEAAARLQVTQDELAKARAEAQGAKAQLDQARMAIDTARQDRDTLVREATAAVRDLEQQRNEAMKRADAPSPTEEQLLQANQAAIAAGLGGPSDREMQRAINLLKKFPILDAITSRIHHRAKALGAADGEAAMHGARNLINKTREEAQVLMAKYEQMKAAYEQQQSETTRMREAAGAEVARLKSAYADMRERAQAAADAGRDTAGNLQVELAQTRKAYKEAKAEAAHMRTNAGVFEAGAKRNFEEVQKLHNALELMKHKANNAERELSRQPTQPFTEEQQAEMAEEEHPRTDTIPIGSLIARLNSDSEESAAVDDKGKEEADAPPPNKRTAAEIETPDPNVLKIAQRQKFIQDLADRVTSVTEGAFNNEIAMNNWGLLREAAAEATAAGFQVPPPPHERDTEATKTSFVKYAQELLGALVDQPEPSAAKTRKTETGEVVAKPPGGEQMGMVEETAAALEAQPSRIKHAKKRK